MSWKSLAVAAFAVVGCVSMAFAGDDLNLDHYLCRQVKDLKAPAKFVGLSVSVVDQTGVDVCFLKKPFLLCDPVDKNGGGILFPSRHLCCYKAKCTSKPLVAYQITDQFGTLTIATKKPKFVCNPCIKNPA